MNLAGWRLWGLTVGLAALLRLPTLGFQSPWMDELSNWEWALEWGFRRAGSDHWLTYCTEALSLRVLGDNLWALRFPSAVASLGIVAFAVWILAGAGERRAAAWAGVLLAISPFQSFYGQDANHYAVLMAGSAAMLAGTALAFESRWRPLPLLACAAVCANGKGWHPIGIFAPGVLGASLCVAALHRPSRIGLADSWRRPLSLGFGLVASLAALKASDRILGEIARVSEGAYFPEARHFGLNWGFWRAALGDLWGALFHHSTTDTALGVACTVLSAAGWTMAARAERRLLPVAIAGGALVAGMLAAFAIVPVPHYFHVRYFAPMAPFAMMGLALLVSHAFRSLSPSRPLLAGTAFAALLLFCMRATVFHVDRLSGDFQPTRAAFRWMRESTEPDAVFLSAHRYTSRTWSFLFRRGEAGAQRQLVALDANCKSPGAAIHSAEAFAADSPRPVYLVSLPEPEERRATEWAEFLDSRCTVAKRFESWVPDEFFPLDWGITFRRIKPRPRTDILALARDGARPDAIYPTDAIGGFAKTPAGFAPKLPPGAGVAFKFEAARKSNGLALEVIGTGFTPAGRGWLVAALDRESFAVWPLEADIATPRRLLLDARVTPGPHRLDVFHASRDGKAIRDEASVLAVLSVSQATDGAQPGYAARLSPPGDFAELAPQLRRGRQLLVLPKGRIASGGDPASPVLFVQWLWPRGLGDLVATPQVNITYTKGGTDFLRMMLPIDWSVEPVLSAAVCAEGGIRPGLESRLSIENTIGVLPRDRRISASTIQAVHLTPARIPK